MRRRGAEFSRPTLAALRADLRRRADPRRATILAGFFKTGPGQYGEGDRFLGITVPQLRALVREYRELPLADIDRLLHSAFHEERLLALLLWVERCRRGDHAERARIYAKYLKSTRYINNWDLVDLSAEHIVGRHLVDRNRRPLYRLARSRKLWERRIAMLASFHYIKRGDFGDALAIARLLLADAHDLIHKAVGWMLREIGKRDRERLEGFLRRHYRRMPRTMLRYAIERLPPARRRQYLSGRVRAT